MIDPFEPAPRLGNGHVMTLWTWARSRQFPALPAPVARVFDVAPGVSVSADCHWHDVPRDYPTLLALHGLEGSSEAHYMRGIADKAWRAGFNVVRLNQRNCGGTEHLCSTLYHSGLTADASAVLRELVATEGLRSLAVAGYSLGGNLALKLAAEWSDAGTGPLHAVCAVSPTMDLERCVRALERRANYAYQWNFVRNLKARMRRKIALFPDQFSSEPLRRIRTVRDFDELYTAPHFGFKDATDYYYRASALRVVDRIRIPALILTAADDPFVPIEPFSDPAITANPAITVHVSPHGGHCAFLTRAGDDDGYWAEAQIVRWAQRYCITQATDYGLRTTDYQPTAP
jgi:predicted alpha/beta-fold hydrolase